MADILILCLCAFFAGFIDSTVGGGGLIQLPSLLIFMPQAAAPTLFGTNKLAAIAGTSVAAFRYARHVEIRWRATLPTALAALLFSFLGARVVTLIQPSVLRPLILVLLVAVAVYTFVRKDFGSQHAPKLSGSKEVWFGTGVGVVLGFYDGFFGPGTGSFLIFAFVGAFGFNFLAASASSKIVNVATNLAALSYFIVADHVLYRIALPMAACNILGSILGTRLAIAKGSRFVRVLFLVVVSAIILRFAYDTLKQFG